MFELKLDTEFNISKTDEVYSQFNNALNDGKGITVFAEAVQKIDTSALQLLLASKRHSKELGLAFEIINPSAEIIRCSEILGINEELGL